MGITLKKEDIVDDVSKFHALCFYCRKKCGNHPLKVQVRIINKIYMYICYGFVQV